MRWLCSSCYTFSFASLILWRMRKLAAISASFTYALISVTSPCTLCSCLKAHIVPLSYTARGAVSAPKRENKSSLKSEPIGESKSSWQTAKKVKLFFRRRALPRRGLWLGSKQTSSSQSVRQKARRRKANATNECKDIHGKQPVPTKVNSQPLRAAFFRLMLFINPNYSKIQLYYKFLLLLSSSNINKLRIFRSYWIQY